MAREYYLQRRPNPVVTVGRVASTKGPGLMRKNAKRNRVVIIGQGYVGLPLAMNAVEAGHAVVGFDVDEERVKSLEAGESYVEDIPAETIQSALATGRYHPSSQPGLSPVLTSPSSPSRPRCAREYPDLSYIEDSAAMLARYLRPGACVVLESTTYPGTTEELVGPAARGGSGLVVGSDFFLGYSPERIDPGNRKWELVRTPKVVSGVNEASLAVSRASTTRSSTGRFRCRGPLSPR